MVGQREGSCRGRLAGAMGRALWRALWRLSVGVELQNASGLQIAWKQKVKRDIGVDVEAVASGRRQVDALIGY